jgi:NAD(P)-dependent dehydrogenase (short-subunit alcohol dehydrogenase family)
MAGVTSPWEGTGDFPPTASVYAAGKAAVTTLTKCLAAQLESEGTNLQPSRAGARRVGHRVVTTWG